MRRFEEEGHEGGTKPKLNIKKLGVVSRDYRCRFPNGQRDFSYHLGTIFDVLEEATCDAVLFSLFSIIPRAGFSTRKHLNRLKHVKVVFIEEFTDGSCRKPVRNIVYHRTGGEWRDYYVQQKFGSLRDVSEDEVKDFREYVKLRRVLGNCCLLICGETNGVKYSPGQKKVVDKFGLRAAIPHSVNVIVNPVHDRMKPFQMPLKRRFLSERGRWVVSVWNKGKMANGRTRDGQGGAWQVYYDGEQVHESEMKSGQLPSALWRDGIEIAVLDIHQGSWERVSFSSGARPKT